MFLDKIKDFWAKKIVKKRLSNVKLLDSSSSIKKVGIVFDESYFYEREALIAELISEGINETDIEILVFKNHIKKNETFDYPVFSYRNMRWNTTIDTPEFNNFSTTNYDLLISYYDIEKAPLMITTNLSKASFKVGFASIDKRLNHFMINTNAENYKVFMEELFKYLKILNKL
ncbi:hypothetical protein OX283_003960 [Flavobacterium sp. SUN052]|uniref:DUF6913 domain-containing protein n=1 Tax=Flavobacterium sp. SUN052 TaxID=3002441 RepID=UPI00237D604F|nr:hypothetical protein [Flavobacterium sp. SUN052]MEC4003799.1 hypothetical protein [Flavobacterium sp. SUN052]